MSYSVLGTLLAIAIGLTISCPLTIYADGIDLVSSSNGHPHPAEVNPVCGADCLFVTLCYLGKGPSTYKDLIRSLGAPHPEGYSMLELQRAAEDHGVFALNVEIEPEMLGNIPKGVVPILLLDNPSHFILLHSIYEDGPSTRVRLQDPLNGYRDLTTDELTEQWRGHVLLVSADPIKLRNDQFPGLQFFLIVLFSFILLAILWKSKSAYVSRG